MLPPSAPPSPSPPPAPCPSSESEALEISLNKLNNLLEQRTKYYENADVAIDLRGYGKDEATGAPTAGGHTTVDNPCADTTTFYITHSPDGCNMTANLRTVTTQGATVLLAVGKLAFVVSSVLMVACIRDHAWNTCTCVLLVQW